MDMVFKARISEEKEKYFQAIWKMLPSLSLEAEFSVSDAGIVIKAMDPARTALVTIELPKAFFESLTCDTPTRFLADVLHVSKIIRVRGEKIELEGDEDAMTIRHIGKEYTRTFKVVNLKTVEVSYPKLGYERDVSITLDAEWFHNVLEDASPVADTFYFKVENNRLIIASEGELSTMEQEVSPGSILRNMSANTQIERAEYFIEYVKDVVDVMHNLVDVVYIRLSEGTPLVLGFMVKEAESKEPVFKVVATFGPKP